VRALLALSGSLLVAALAAPAAFGQLLPVEPESPNAEAIRDSYVFVSIFVVAIFLLVEGLLIAFIVRYRRRNRERFEDGVQIHGATKLELAWTAFPVVILFAIGAFVLAQLPEIRDPPQARAGDELEIRVSGRQFHWQYEYPNGVVAIDRLRAPAGIPVRLVVTAPEEDVIHSWWIPALGGKIDAIPGRVNETWLLAERPGTYPGQCAELCGVQPAGMLAVAEVMEEEAFDTWLSTREAEQSEVSMDLGEETWQGVCAKCHGLGGEGGVAPRSIANSPLLADAETVERIVRNGIRTMPAVGAGWSDEHVRALTTYLQENPPGGS